MPVIDGQFVDVPTLERHARLMCKITEVAFAVKYVEKVLSDGTYAKKVMEINETLVKVLVCATRSVKERPRAPSRPGRDGTGREMEGRVGVDGSMDGRGGRVSNGGSSKPFPKPV